jgi:hypothetical protein
VVEGEAANRVLTLAGLTGTPVCIAHLTCREALAAVEGARARGQAVYAEVCPQHLLLSVDDYDRPGFEEAKFVFSPPLRDRPAQADSRGTLYHCCITTAVQVVRVPLFEFSPPELSVPSRAVTSTQIPSCNSKTSEKRPGDWTP